MTLKASDQLGRIGGACALAFALCIILFALVDSTGTADDRTSHAMAAIPLALYVAVGLMSSTSDPSEFQIAGGRIAAASAGMAAAAQWTAAAFILGAPAAPLTTGDDGPPMLIGLTGGYILSAILIGPFLRNSCARTLPAFLGLRYGGLVRLLGVMVLIVCSLIFITALIQAGVGTTVRALAIDADAARAAIVGVIILCALPGGMAGVTATQVAQYAVLLVGVVLTAFFIDAGEPLPAAEAVGPGATASVHGIPFHMALDDDELMLCLMAGTASLPHVLMHPMTTRGMAEARMSAVWSLLFIALLVLPGYRTLAVTAAHQAPPAAMSASGSGLLAGIFLTGVLAAASALLFTTASSLEHDLFRRLSASRRLVAPKTILTPRAFARRRMTATRAFTIIVAALAGYAAQSRAFEPRAMLMWAFSLAAGGFFPALVLGIWWPRASSAGAACGMVAGFGLCLFYLTVSRYFPQAGVNLFGMSALIDPASGRVLVDTASVMADPRWLADVPASAANPLALNVGWLNIEPAACGILGLAAGFLAAVAVSLAGQPPSMRQRAWIEALHAPGMQPPLPM